MARIFYVVGASGAGKDSVLTYVRERIEIMDKCVFAHRYITRPADAGGENHVALTDLEFEVRSEGGLFCMEWASHRLRYGIGREMLQWLERGYDVVLNGSRAYLETAQLQFPELVPILIEVEPDILRKRLIARNRESLEEIENRIQRSREVADPPTGVLRIKNNEQLHVAGERFLSLIRSSAAAAPPLELENQV